MSDRRPLFVRLPSEAADTLDRAVLERNVSKQDLVAELIVGRADLKPAAQGVLLLGEAAALLQTTDAAVAELLEAGGLPGRQIGGEWRLSRAAVLRWLEHAA